MTLLRTATAALVAFLAGAGLVLLASWSSSPGGGAAPPPRAAGVSEEADATLPAATPAALERRGAVQARIDAERRSVIVEAVERAAPSVASVVIRGRRRVMPFGREFFDFFSTPFRSYDRIFTLQAGSAVLISDDGEAITNDHVVAGAEEVYLLLPDGRIVEAELVGTSSTLDLALLRIDPDGVEAAPIGRSDDLLVGEWSVAIGYPVGGTAVTSTSRAQPSVTVGVISATGRSFTPPSTNRRARDVHYYPDMIQTDADINPGNSGGPLVNAMGEVIGINTFILSESGGSQGLGFAIPIERAVRAAEEFREYGEVRPTDIRISVQRVNANLAEALGLEAPRGLLITDAAGAAREAGLRAQDVLLAIDGNAILSLEEARLALLPRFVGDSVSLTVWRDGDEIELTMLLEEAG